MVSEEHRQTQERLRNELRRDPDGGKLENLAAALLGRMLGVTVSVARSGFQHGADAGTAGRQGRHLRIESKCYAPGTRLSERELLGEFEQAQIRDMALEAWVLVTTQEVPEQVEQSLSQKGESDGIPVVIIDWKGDDLLGLAALCASAPDLVESLFSSHAASCAKELAPVADQAIVRLKRDLETWSLGYQSVRAKARVLLEKIWSSPRDSQALFGQDAAGGAQLRRIERAPVMQTLDAWWAGPAAQDSPAIAVGSEGDGKTWAVFDWLVSRADELPIVLVIPAPALPAMGGVSEMSLRRFLAGRLFEACRVRSVDHWDRRLERLLKRPPGEGPALTVFFDGMNQEPSFRWLELFKLLQGSAFAGRVRVLASTRTRYYTRSLNCARGLLEGATRVDVGPFDLSEGGEFDHVLRLHALSRADLLPDLVKLAHRPRLFALVVRLRDMLTSSGDVTVHRLLWEYGRDTLGVRSGRSFSEPEWQEWLRLRAADLRSGIQSYQSKEIEGTVARPDLDHQQVAARLSDIIDGRFACEAADRPGVFELDPLLVTHALAVGLLSQLDAVPCHQVGAITSELDRWLDPIGGLDEQTEVLRAALSIFVERGGPDGSPVGTALATAWLQSQSLPEAHRREVAGIAVAIPSVLLEVVEASTDSAFASARQVAVRALRSIDPASRPALAAILERLTDWCATVSYEKTVSPGMERWAKERRERLLARLGVAHPTSLKVLGARLRLVDNNADVLASIAPAILEAFPLAGAMPVFRATAVALAVTGRHAAWDGFKWLVLLNKVDEDAARLALRTLAREVADEKTPPGVDPRLARRAAALLLWLSGEQPDEVEAADIDPGLEPRFSYEADYLADPARSFLPLERRHASAALLETPIPLLSRLRRCGEMWLDPTFEPPQTYVSELVTWANAVDPAKLDLHPSETSEDHEFGLAAPALARVAPQLLVDLTRKKLRALSTRKAEARYWGAVRATEHLLVVGAPEKRAVRSLRTASRELEFRNESIVRNELLLLELVGMAGDRQHEILTEADLEDVFSHVALILRPLSPAYAEAAPRSPERRARDLAVFLGLPGAQITESLWNWLVDLAFGTSPVRPMAHRALARFDSHRLASELLRRDWHWSPSATDWENDFASGTLIDGASSAPFADLVTRVAPWRLLEAARLRGARPDEVRLAARIVDRMVMGRQVNLPEPHIAISVDHDKARTGPLPFAVSVDLQPRGAGVQDFSAVLNLAQDLEAWNKAYDRAADAAVLWVRGAQQGGATLFRAGMAPDDVRCVAEHAPELISRWLEGAEQTTGASRQRVRLAEGFYLALCEALLALEPERGVILWHALSRTLRIQHLGIAEVNELVHLPFRAPSAGPVDALRAHLLDSATTDVELLHVAIAAEANGKTGWLQHAVAEDLASPSPRRLLRGLIFKGFTQGETPSGDDVWPIGESATSFEALKRTVARSVARDSWARHWWRRYLAAPTRAEAYAAWVMFLHSADRRAWVWVSDEMETHNDAPHWDLKVANLEVNQSTLERMMEKRHEHLNKDFLGRRIVQGIGPWAEENPS